VSTISLVQVSRGSAHTPGSSLTQIAAVQKDEIEKRQSEWERLLQERRKIRDELRERLAQVEQSRKNMRDEKSEKGAKQNKQDSAPSTSKVSAHLTSKKPVPSDTSWSSSSSMEGTW